MIIFPLCVYRHLQGLYIGDYRRLWVALRMRKKTWFNFGFTSNSKHSESANPPPFKVQIIPTPMLKVDLTIKQSTPGVICNGRTQKAKVLHHKEQWKKFRTRNLYFRVVLMNISKLRVAFFSTESFVN